MRFLVTRPRHDAQTMARLLEKMGHEGVISPVMEPVCLPDTPLPDPACLKALIITSRNALRCLAQKADITPLSPCVWQDRTLFAVGKATGRQAVDLGFKTIIYGNGRASALPDFINGFKPHFDPQNNLPLYYPVGRKKAFDLAPVLRQQGFSLFEQTLYETSACPDLTEKACKALAANALDGVILMSPRSARLFGQQLQRAGLETALATIPCLCLSQNVADALPPSSKARLIAPAPDMDAIFTLIEQLNES